MPTPRPIMTPMNGANSGIVMTWLSKRRQGRAETDADEGHTDGQAHGQHRPEGDDQDDDGEGQAQQLGGRLLEVGEDEPAQLDGQAVDLGRLLQDRVPDLRGAGEVALLGQLDVGVGDQARLGPLGGDELLTALGVGTVDPGHVVEAGDQVEELLHLLLDLGVVHALFGPEDDRARVPGSLAPELLVEQVEAVAGLHVGQVEVIAERAADTARDAVQDEQGEDPPDEYEPAAVVTPGTEASEHGDLRGAADDDSSYPLRLGNPRKFIGRRNNESTW